jgi:hypothetical protein
MVSGRNVLIKHLMTIKPVTADAENSPNASTTYASSGINASNSVNPTKPSERSRNGSGR